MSDRKEASAHAGRRNDVLTTLKRASDPMSILAIADSVAVHPNTVRFHLDRLVEDGLVQRAEPRRRIPGRPPQLFQAVHGMDPTGPRQYRMLAELLLGELANRPDAGPQAVQTGRAWGREARHSDPDDAAESLPALVDLLDELGFAPEADADGRSIRLRHCPFLELAADGQRTVCHIHLGLMQGALETRRSPLTVDRLEPFAEPDHCLAHLRQTEATA
ncbi:metalloregulator ArsR/SmtB family transcription factor [Glycomyces sp. YM15]|uniref:helix-turn-helix transcriptional regulator n=1 Tax=Glycomyces sp. YM15 TaxID=2800446 RepID=UPI0019662369|nr:helix-turn-helix domain-containing protein [Glycomyces sp. YM15]